MSLNLSTESAFVCRGDEYGKDWLYLRNLILMKDMEKARSAVNNGEIVLYQPDDA